MKRRHGFSCAPAATSALLALFPALQVLTTTADVDPFAFFQPTLTLRSDDRRRLDRGDPIVRVVPGDASEVAVFAAVPIEIDGDRLVAWMRRIEELKQSSRVLAIGRFSDPPRIEDLAELSLDDEDLSAIRSCQPGRCGLKLTADEIAELRRVTAGAGQDWKSLLQQAFRTMVLNRVNAYRAGGLAALPPYADDGDGDVWPSTAFATLLGHSVFLSERLPAFVEHLSGRTPLPDVESFVYWSKERLARKAIISATHVSIMRTPDERMPDALVSGKEIFATHYVNASLGLTTIIRGGDGSHNYLAYLNRSEIDVLGGMFGGLVRSVLERRLRIEAVDVLQGLRRRLEGGEPAGIEQGIASRRPLRSAPLPAHK